MSIFRRKPKPPLLTSEQQRAVSHARAVLDSFRAGEERALLSALGESGLSYMPTKPPKLLARIGFWLRRKLRR